MMSEFQIKVLMFLWKNGPASATDIYLGTGAQLAYRTLSFYLKIMENKGFIGHERVGRTYTYYSLVNQEFFFKEQIDKIISELFKKDK